MICSLCMKAEGLQFENMRALYCAPCFEARKASWGVVTEVLPGLYLSGMREAEIWTDGTRLCVHEDTPTYEGGLHVPILAKKPNSFKDRTGAIASIEALDKVADIIEYHQKNEDPLLVHCWGGAECSPLAVAWYLSQVGFGYLEDAYAFLKEKRPVVSPRIIWLPK